MHRDGKPVPYRTDGKRNGTQAAHSMGANSRKMHSRSRMGALR